jgi:hypothetical protein
MCITQSAFMTPSAEASAGCKVPQVTCHCRPCILRGRTLRSLEQVFCCHLKGLSGLQGAAVLLCRLQGATRSAMCCCSGPAAVCRALIQQSCCAGCKAAYVMCRAVRGHRLTTWPATQMTSLLGQRLSHTTLAHFAVLCCVLCSAVFCSGR